MRSLGSILFMMLAGATGILASCSGDGGGKRCERGSEGCACLSGDIPCRGEDLVCSAEGICERDPCPAGRESCECFPDERCETITGGVLTCDAGRCIRVGCTAGELGCSCLADLTCAAADATCTEGRCMRAACAPGELHCPCNNGLCVAGLRCQDNSICVSNAGYTGGPCKEDGTCFQGNRCVVGLCVPCDIGTRGCSCLSTATCGNGLACVSDLCVHEAGEALPRPASPRCYTPCEDDLRAASGAVRTCSAEGLMEGCVGEASCQDGSCLRPGEAPRGCASDIDCPDFQACMGGRCYSNCEYDSDCASGLACYRHVCRIQCSTSGAGCPEGQHCATRDGENGYCMPLKPAQGEPQRESAGTLRLDRDALAFSNIAESGELTITNDSKAYAEIVIRKVQHLEYTDEKPVTVENTPLHWVRLGEAGNVTQRQELRLGVAAGASVRIRLEGTRNPVLARWDGLLEVASAKLGKRTVRLSYAETPQGRWSGTLYFFTTFGDGGLAEWVAQGKPNTGTVMQGVKNAFVQRWGAFKAGQLDSYDEFLAVLTATLSGSWAWPSVREVCRAAAPYGACYLYSSPQGYAIYTDSLESYPVPSGIVQTPLAINLRPDPEAGSAAAYSGRIESSQSLQYAGLPRVSLTFANDPADCTTRNGGQCLVQVTGFAADVYVGGRYRPQGGTCAASFEKVRTPWLVPGFLEGTVADTQTSLLYREECRDELLPFGDAAEHHATNASFAASNPVPDGNVRSRHIELVDGLLVNQSSMLLIVKETFRSFLGGGDFAAYGLMWLRRETADLSPDDFAGVRLTHGELDRPPRNLPAVSCSQALLDQIEPGLTITNASIGSVVSYLIKGRPPAGAGTVPAIGTGGNLETAHYLCVDTGLINGGNEVDGSLACPWGSEVRYFTVTKGDAAAAGAFMRNLSCQDAYDASDPARVRRGTCEAVLDGWLARGDHGVRPDVKWSCTDPNEVFCSDDRFDLRAGKVFYQALPASAPAKAVFNHLDTDLDGAFRYKTRFRSRSGTALGFAPAICQPYGSESVPYCYDPPVIEAIAARVDCLLDLYANHQTPLAANPTAKAELVQYLRRAFASEYSVDPTSGAPLAYDGFERLNAELLIMMGDESYTRAFASRFDLAGSNTYGFEGDLFEPGGIRLSGGAGFEMFTLYRATQYYQMALDRFYATAPVLGRSLAAGADNFVTAETVSSYFERLIRASTQKARASSEVAKRYQSFHRPELARLVIERAYTATYLESVLLSRIMLQLIEVLAAEQRPEVVVKVELAAHGYRSALLEMNDVHQSIQDDLTFFGFAPDYVPFPALEAGGGNAFDALIASARQKMQVAAEKERLALANDRSFETDAASFQSELARIKNTYESRLGELCGMVEVNGRIYPATSTYAHLVPALARVGDPCGLVGNGQIYEAKVGFELAALELESVATGMQNVLAEAQIEEDRIDELCDVTDSFAITVYEKEGNLNKAQQRIQNAQEQIGAIQRTMQLAGQLTSLAKCTTGMASDCIPAAVASAVYAGAWQTAELGTQLFEEDIQSAQKELDNERRDLSKLQIQFQCDTAKVDSVARVRGILLRLAELQLEAEKAKYRIATALSQIQKLVHEAKRLASEQDESKQLTLDIEAARNDPNVRIYKNDAVLNADRTFQAAVREVYKATKVYEYYTSQSYAKLGDLFLVRMVAAGDLNLESYVAELEDAFAEFEERFGNPDVRVAIVSLRDDVLRIPRIDKTCRPLTGDERVSLFREKLRDATLLDARGYISLPFGTSLDMLSPLTSTHKVLYLEAEIIGSDIGDTLGRLYARQVGTGVVRTVAGGKLYYAFPERSAVLNPFFNGTRVFVPEVYRNSRLRDRPFVNTRWELVINQKDEQVNQDINLQSLTDIRLYVYYTDFTSL